MGPAGLRGDPDPFTFINGRTEAPNMKLKARNATINYLL